MSQWEREAIGERTAFALAHKRRNRRAYGAVPFGYRREGDALLPVLAQQAAFARMRMMHTQGASLRQIAATRDRGYAPKARAKLIYLALWEAAKILAHPGK